ncbi:unnamed protein product [Rotaria socialis]|uniref:Peptidase S9A N-terminal domain-containing protein n=1 Tax=Rotaria socialis TaxID=392032 RepID=A0A818AIR6_9BILA|nr:unnamed protein product [Rotaria socialis]
MNKGLQNQDGHDGFDSLSKSTDPAKLLIDPNTFFQDGTMTTLSLNYSFDGKNVELQQENEVTPTTIAVTHTDIQAVYFHRFHTPLVRSDDEKYLIASITKFISQETKLWFVPLSKSPNSIVENPNWSKLIVNLDFVYEFITSEDDLFYLRTNSQAENVRLITMNTKTNEIKEIISEDKNEIRRSTYQLCTYKYRETKSNIFTKIKTEILKYGIQQFDNNLIFYLKLIVQYMI